MGKEQYEFQPEEKRPAAKKVFQLERRHVLICLIFIILLLVVVGVASAVLAGNHARHEEREKIKGEHGDGSSTTQPATDDSAVTTSSVDPVTTPSGPRMAWDEIRLPRDIVPTHYDLTVQPYSSNKTFVGTQVAHFDVISTTSTILIHIKSMVITRATVHATSGAEATVAKSFAYPKNEYYVVETAQPLVAGGYRMTLEYKANISDTLTGFYPSDYTTADGQKKILFTTKFQPTDARKAFPCFDEPNLKATYNVTVIHESHFNARSNMKGTTSVRGDGWKVTKFDKSVKMSSYLIAFIVSEFSSLNDITGVGNNIDISVWTHQDQLNSGNYSLHLGKRMLTFLETFFNVSYPLPKLDMFAIPDYGSGATEHWGIITYRESRLLYKEGVSSIGNKEGIAGIVSHELAHLWFGNLVTCKWWNDLWIQEGMASYMEYYVMDDAEPDWKVMEQIITSEWKPGLDLDALASSHPISMAVEHPKQIKEIFDSITYRKGASILRMIDSYLGKEEFRKGVERYLKTHQFTGATSDDFWNALKTNDVDVPAIMSTWTKQMGFPVVTFERTTGDTVKVTQNHFLLDPDAKVERTSPFGYKWTVPLKYSLTSNGSVWTRKRTLFKESEVEVSIPRDSIIKGNSGQTGFFRVNYDADNWAKLTQMLLTNHKALLPSERAGTIDDAFALARAGQLNYAISLNVTKYLNSEDSYIVWSVTLQNWKFIDSLLGSTSYYGPFRKYVISQLAPIVQTLGWNMVGSHLEKVQRILVLSYACSFGHVDSLNQAKMMFDAWMNNDTKINPELQSLVLRYGVALGGEREWNFVYGKYMQSSNAVEKSRLRTALGRTTQPWILRKWLALSMDPTVVRSQDTVYVITGIAGSNPIGKYVVWDFARANWDQLMTIMSANNFHVTRLTAGITSQFTTAFELQQMRDFWNKKPDAGAGAQARLQGIEKVQTKIKWIEKYAYVIGTWLTS